MSNQTLLIYAGNLPVGKTPSVIKDELSATLGNHFPLDIKVVEIDDIGSSEEPAGRPKPFGDEDKSLIEGSDLVAVIGGGDRAYNPWQFENEAKKGYEFAKDSPRVNAEYFPLYDFCEIAQFVMKSTQCRE